MVLVPPFSCYGTNHSCCTSRAGVCGVDTALHDPVQGIRHGCSNHAQQQVQRLTHVSHPKLARSNPACAPRLGRRAADNPTSHRCMRGSHYLRLCSTPRGFASALPYSYSHGRPAAAPSDATHLSSV